MAKHPIYVELIHHEYDKLEEGRRTMDGGRSKELMTQLVEERDLRI